MVHVATPYVQRAPIEEVAHVVTRRLFELFPTHRFVDELCLRAEELALQEEDTGVFHDAEHKRGGYET